MDWPGKGAPGKKGARVSWSEQPERAPSGDLSLFQEPTLNAPIPILIPVQSLAKSYLAAGLRGDVDMLQTMAGGGTSRPTATTARSWSPP